MTLILRLGNVYAIVCLSLCVCLPLWAQNAVIPVFGHKRLHFISHNYLCCCPQMWWVFRVLTRLMPGEQNSSAKVLREWSAKISVLISASFSFCSFFFLFHCSLYINLTPLPVNREVVNTGCSSRTSSKCILEERNEGACWSDGLMRHGLVCEGCVVASTWVYIYIFRLQPMAPIRPVPVVIT